MNPNLITIGLTGILVTIIGCGRPAGKSSQLNDEAWWAEKSHIISESAAHHDGVMIDLKNHPTSSSGAGWRRWNVVIPVDSKRSVEDLKHSLAKLADDFANPLVKADPFLTGRSGATISDTRLIADSDYPGGYAVSNGGPACVRQVISQGAGGMVWVRAEVMAKGRSAHYFTVMDGDYDDLPKTPPEATKAIFLDIMVTKWK